MCDSCLFAGASLAKANVNSEQTVKLLQNITVPNKRHVVCLWSCVLLSYCRKSSPWKRIESCPKHQRHCVQCHVNVVYDFFLFSFVGAKWQQFIYS